MGDAIKTEAEAIADLARQAQQGIHAAMVQDPMGGMAIPVVAIPASMRTVDVMAALDARLQHPRRKVGTVAAESLDALIALVNRQKSEATVVYVAEAALEENGQTSPEIVVVLNDHFSTEGAAGHRDHRITYAPELSDEWKIWTGQDGKHMNQAQFCAWIEDHLLDLADPSAAGDKTKSILDALGVTAAGPAELRGLARDFSVRSKTQIKEAINLQSGETQVLFASAHETDAGQPVTVPGAFLVQIPVFKFGAPFVFVARLRYRLDGAIFWHYKLTYTERAMRAALDDMIARIRKECGVLVVEGRP